jgi:hypothetical protein
MRTFISQAGLAKRLGMGENTIASRLRSRAVGPDGILLQPIKPDVLLFEVENLPSLRARLATHKHTEANIEA